ncbi:hypothetical protein EYF80_033230 [Liparis tanakae]|uniref:Uncharacterized protein n=1 Tax=Liparis tanakae TaxID=230148 RepID=A0A4Z2GTX3_9TELE|nr:hypothetical protein EYF80_033230 [Liparis tanakae]
MLAPPSEALRPRGPMPLSSCRVGGCSNDCSWVGQVQVIFRKVFPAKSTDVGRPIGRERADRTLYSSCCVGCKLWVGMSVCIWPMVGASWRKGGWGTAPRGKPGGSFWRSSCISVLRIHRRIHPKFATGDHQGKF